MVNTGNTRRESTQALPDPAAGRGRLQRRRRQLRRPTCVFQQRLPALDYDMAMYITTAPPDPTYLTPIFTCDQIPSEENGNQGQNQQGVVQRGGVGRCSTSPTSTVDEDARAELDHRRARRSMAEDDVMLPLFQFPKSGAWRTDKVGGPVDGRARQLPGLPQLRPVGGRRR